MARKWDAETGAGASPRSWLRDRVVLCILLHAGFNTAMSSAGLRTENALQRWDYILALGLGVLTIWAGVALLIKLTGGRLGHHESTTPAPLTTPLSNAGAPTRAPALATLERSCPS